MSITALCIGAISGPLIGMSFMPPETEIELDSETVAKVARDSDSNKEIQYLTTGPTISWFHESFFPDFLSGQVFGHLELKTDGKKGVLQLSIPKTLMQELEMKEVGKVTGGISSESLPFQVLTTDSSFEVIRIDVPEGDNLLAILSQTSTPLDYLIAISIGFGILIFIGTLVGIASLLAGLKKIRQLLP